MGKLELVKKTSLELLNYLQNKHNWKQIFDACYDELSKFDQIEKLPDDESISRLFDLEEFRVIENEIKNGKNRNILEDTRHKFEKLFIKSEYEESLASQFSQLIISKLLQELRAKFPDKYTLEIIDTLYKASIEELKNQENMLTRLDQLPSEISSILSENIFNAHCKTINDKDNELKTIMEPQIDLSFFDFEDNEFRNKLNNSIEVNNEIIYIKGYSREETLFCVLYELSIIEKIKDNVYIVDNMSTWENLYDKVHDKILIPNFFNSEIKPQKDNITIFIYGIDQHPHQLNVLELKNRLSKNLHKKLIEIFEKANLDNSGIQELLNQTHGKYSALKRRLSKSQLQGPSWFAYGVKQNPILIKALLLGGWDDSDANHLKHFLDGISYDDFIEALTPFMKGDDPFIVKQTKSYFAEEGYQITSVEEAWLYLGSFVTKKQWNNYKTLCNKLLPFDPKTDGKMYSNEQNPSFYQADLKPNCSTLLRRGLCNNLIACNESLKKYCKDSNNFIDDIVKIVLESIEDEHSWSFFLLYSQFHMEASPELVLKRIEEEISLEKNSPLIRLFENPSYIGWNQPSSYIYAFSSLTLLFSYKHFISRAIDCLCKINDLKLNLLSSNTPSASLRYIFCPWFHDSILSVDEIKYQAKRVTEKYSTGWYIIAQELPDFISKPILGSQKRPRTKYLREAPSISQDDVFELYTYYTCLCVETINNDVNQWIEILDKQDIFRYACEKVLEHLQQTLTILSDQQRKLIKNKLRAILNRNRKFANSDWALPERLLKKIEKCYESIVFENKVYDYTHLFDMYLGDSDLDIHPKLWKENNTDYHEQIDNEERFITEKMIEFREQKYDLKELLHLAGFESGNRLIFGRVIAKVYSSDKINEHLLSLLIKMRPEKGLAIYYVSGLFEISNNNRTIILEALEIARKYEATSDLIVELAKTDLSTVNNNDIENYLTQEEIKLFWMTLHQSVVYRVPNSEIKILLENSLQFGNCELFFSSLEKKLPDIDNKTILAYLEKAAEIKLMDYSAPYLIKNIFKHLYRAANFIKENEKIIAHLELFFLEKEAFGEETCLRSLLNKDPSYYAYFLNILYKHEDIEEPTRKDIDFNKISQYYNTLKFCPGIIEDQVDYSLLKQWISDFKELLVKQHQLYLLESTLGQLFAHSPIGKDGFEPHESVRQVIESFDGNSNLYSSYISERLNMRGSYIENAGRDEFSLANTFKINSENIVMEYPHTAKIYKTLSSYYQKEGEEARVRAEQHSWF